MLPFIRVIALLTAALWFGIQSCALATSPTVSAAPAATFDSNNRDLQLVDDKECASGKALELRFHGKFASSAPLPVLTASLAGPLTAGLYRVTVRLKMQGMLHSLGTGIAITACGWDSQSKRAGESFAGRTLYLNEFAAEDAWQTFTLDFDLHPADLVRTRFDEKTFTAFLNNTDDADRLAALRKSILSLQLPADRLAALRKWILDNPQLPVPLQSSPASLEARQVESINRAGALPDTVAITISLPHPPRGNTPPFPSLRRLYVDTVSLERLPEPAVVVRDIRARKAWLRPGENQSFAIDLHNRSGATQTAKLTVNVEAGLLEAPTRLPPVPVELKNNEYATVTMDWNVPANHRLWGQTAIANLEIGGKIVSSWRTWFTVHPRVVSVMIPWNDNFFQKEAVNFHEPTASKPNVGNLYEYWAPTPSDAAGLVPDDLQAPFMAGNSGKVESLAKQAGKVSELKQHGIAALFYCEAHGTGLKAWDTYWNHPEWCAPSEPTSDLFYLKRRDNWPAVETWYLQGEASNKKARGLPLTAAEQAALERPRIDRMPDIIHVGFVTLNCIVPQVINNIIHGTSTLMDQVPYLGCRWDTGKPLACYETDALGRDLGKSPAELDQMTVQNIERYLREVRAKHPEFEVGFNYGHGQLMGKRDDPFDFEAAKKVVDNDPVCKTILADGGYILEEAWAHSFEVWNDYKIVARNYLRACRIESAAYKSAGGQHGHMSPDGGAYTPDNIYQGLFSLLGGAHLALYNYGPIPESQYDLGVYAARFAEFFWDPKLRQLTNLGEKVRVETDADLWFTEAGFEKDTETGSRLYVLPVINPPVTERWLKNRYGLLPSPVRHPLAVTVAVPAGFTGVKAVYHLENNPWPVVKALPFETDKKEVRFELPELVTFKVAVVEFTK